MDDERFDLLVNVLKIIERKRSPATVQSLMEIVDAYNEDLTASQKSFVLRNILEFTRRDDERSQHFKQAEEVDWERRIDNTNYFF